MNENNNFLDKKTLISFALIIGFWLIWSHFVDNKYPTPKPADKVVDAAAVPGAEQAPMAGEASLEPATAQKSAGTATRPEIVPGTTAESLSTYKSENLNFDISNYGMGLKDITVNTYKARDNGPIILGRVERFLPFSTYLMNSAKPVVFQIEHPEENTFVGHGSLGETQITKTIHVHPADYSMDVEINVENVKDGFAGLTTYLSDVMVEQKKAGFMAPPIEQQSIYVFGDNSTTRQVLNPEKDYKLQANNVSVFSLDLHYFAMAIAENSELQPSLSIHLPEKSTVASGALNYPRPSSANSMKIKYTAFAGPKSFDILSHADERFGNVINYGMFAVIARPLLGLMKFFYKLVHNYGVAIILLTLLVRALVMPFNIYSFKSMKVMQKLQPQMTLVREKYKDDKMVQNQKIMELMKENKANPLGGCLPMLLQLPVFFALYQTLGQSIELYREPFGLWITDLSFRDPYFVLPVLMGATMFLQQKITPTNMDPQQAKIMQFMPLIFSFFMLSLPAGLTLYIFVSTLFGIIQQYIFLKDKTPTTGQVKQVQA